MLEMKRHNCSLLARCVLCIRRYSAGSESVGSSERFPHSLELICADPKLVLAVTDTGPTCQPAGSSSLTYSLAVSRQ